MLTNSWIQKIEKIATSVSMLLGQPSNEVSKPYFSNREYLVESIEQSLFENKPNKRANSQNNVKNTV